MTKEEKITIDDLKKNPVLKPFSEYKNVQKIFEEEDKRESENLKKAIDVLTKLTGDGVYDHSLIARRYQDAINIYDRLMWIYSKCNGEAESKIKEMKEIVEKGYISKEKYEKEVKELQGKLDQLNEYVEELKIVKKNSEEEPPIKRKKPKEKRNLKEEIKELAGIMNEN